MQVWYNYTNNISPMYKCTKTEINSANNTYNYIRVIGGKITEWETIEW